MMDTLIEIALGDASPRFGTSRRSQHKRSLHSRGVLQQPQASAVVVDPPTAKRPRVKVAPRRALTAPSQKGHSQCDRTDTIDTAGARCPPATCVTPFPLALSAGF